MTDSTVIGNAAWLVAWDGMASGGGHRTPKAAELAFRGETTVHLGQRIGLESWAGKARVAPLHPGHGQRRQ